MLRIRGCKERKHKTAVKHCKLCDTLVGMYYDRMDMIKSLEEINDNGFLDVTIKLLQSIDRFEIYK